MCIDCWTGIVGITKAYKCKTKKLPKGYNISMSGQYLVDGEEGIGNLIEIPKKIGGVVWDTITTMKPEAVMDLRLLLLKELSNKSNASDYSEHRLGIEPDDGVCVCETNKTGRYTVIKINPLKHDGRIWDISKLGLRLDEVGFYNVKIYEKRQYDLCKLDCAIFEDEIEITEPYGLGYITGDTFELFDGISRGKGYVIVVDTGEALPVKTYIRKPPCCGRSEPHLATWENELEITAFITDDLCETTTKCCTDNTTGGVFMNFSLCCDILHFICDKDASFFSGTLLGTNIARALKMLWASKILFNTYTNDELFNAATFGEERGKGVGKAKMLRNRVIQRETKSDGTQIMSLIECICMDIQNLGLDCFEYESQIQYSQLNTKKRVSGNAF